MAEKWNRNKNRADGHKIEEMRKHYPGTPEHFRRAVEQAVNANLKATEKSGIERKVSGRNGYREEQGLSDKNDSRRMRKKIWLVAAAVLAFGGAAVAAGRIWFPQYLMEQGYSESDAEALVVADPRQQMTELPVDEAKIVEEHLLTITSACFDGNRFYFTATPSQEAENNELYLRDHASVNGLDGVTSLVWQEEEGEYLGIITFQEQEGIDALLEADTVNVEIRAAVTPKYPTGRILNPWKDEEAYEKLFKTGAFQSEYYGSCCVLTTKERAEDALQRITVEIPVTEESKQLIEKYRNIADRAEREVTAAMGVDVGIRDTAESSEDIEVKGIAETEDISQSDGNTEGTAVYTGARINGTHVICEMPGPDGSVTIDAEIIKPSVQVYAGTLKAELLDAEIMKTLYEEGTQEQWQRTEDGWQSQDQNIRITADGYDHLQYDNDMVSENGQGSTSDAEEEKQICRDALAKLGLSGTVKAEVIYPELSERFYSAQGELEGLPIAWWSQWRTESLFTVDGGKLCSISIPGGRLSVLEKEAVELPDLESTLQNAAKYVVSGDISVDWMKNHVVVISLEYYVDLTSEGIVFRPVWNFKNNLPGEEGDAATEDYFYIDCLTGALVF